MPFHIFDLLLTISHLTIISFNLFGWIWKSTRRVHFYFILATAFSWLILGIWFGLGYCPLTDWHWEVKNKLGEHNLPGSFIKYFADEVTGGNISSILIDYITAACFAFAAFLSVYFNFIFKKKHI